MQKFQKHAPLIPILLGIYFRLQHIPRIPVGTPFRLGGLFYEFSRQIIENNYALPKNIPFYSAGGIPFAYPPLGFYVQAFIIDIFSPPRFWTVNWLPPLVAALTVPSFYFLLRKLTDDKNLVLGALFAYALMPAAFTNQIEAAGLAEAFGTLSLIWYAHQLIGLQKTGRWQNIVGAGIWLAASVSSSPGSAVGAVIGSLLFCGQMFLNGNKFTIRLVFAGVGGFILSAPYWLTVIHNHGFAIFATPMGGQFNGETGSWIVRFIQSFLTFNYAGGEFAILWNLLILLGLLWYILQEKAFLPLLFVLLALIPREGVWLTALVTPLFAGAGLVYIAAPLLKTAFNKLSSQRVRLRFFTGAALLVMISLFMNATLALENLHSDPEWQISAAQIAELERLKSDIPSDAQVLVVGNQALEEWAPQILRREVINTQFGLEWQPDEYARYLAIYEAIETDQNWDDVLNASAANELYLLIDTEKALHLGTSQTSLQTLIKTQHFKLVKLSIKGY